MSNGPDQNTDKKTKESKQQIADDERYSPKTAENYERFFVPAIGRPLAIDLLSQSTLQKGERVLDVACGTGIVARLASRQVGDTGSVTGLDINPGMLEVARSTTKHLSTVTWQESSAEAMPFHDETFEVVLCQLGLQFMEDKSAALREMRRVLAAGGRLTLNVPGPAGQIFAIFSEAMERNLGFRAAEFVNRVFSLHDTTKLGQLLRDANFRDIEIDAKITTLYLPSPRKFLWQYLHSTPLMQVVSETSREARISLEQDIAGKWRDFEEDDGTMKYQQRILLASALK